MKTCKSQLKALLLAILIPTIVACGSDSNIVTNDISNPPPPANTSAKLYEIVVEPKHAQSYLPIQYSAIGKYDDGSEADITALVEWTTLTSGMAYFENTGKANPLHSGQTKVTASMAGITSDEATLEIIPTLICGHLLGHPVSTEVGGGINDQSKNNASGECIKIRQITDGVAAKPKWFTSSPSEQVLTELGYTIQDDADNLGDTYSSLHFDTSAQGSFGLFRHDGSGVVLPGTGNDSLAGVNGQSDRWCQKLTSISFGGRSDWRRPTEREPEALFTYENPTYLSMYDRFGWPVDIRYVSMRVSGSRFSTLFLYPRLSALTAPDTGTYVTCVSEQE